MQDTKTYTSITNHGLIGTLIKKQRFKNKKNQLDIIKGICRREILANLEKHKKVKDKYYYLIAKRLNKELIIDDEIDNKLNELLSDIYDNVYYINKDKLKENKDQLELTLKDVKDTLYYESYYNILSIILDYFLDGNHQENYDKYFDIYDLFNDKVTEMMSIVLYIYYYQVNFDKEKMDYYINKILKSNSPLANYYRIYSLSNIKNYLTWINEYDRVENGLVLHDNYSRTIKLYIYKLSFIDILGEELGDLTLKKALLLIENHNFDDKYKASCYYNRGISLMRRNKCDKAIKILRKYLTIKNNKYIALIIACFEHKLETELPNDNLTLIEYFNCSDDKEKIKLIPKIMKELKQLNHYPLINAFKYECYYICKKEGHYKIYIDYLDMFENELNWEVK